MLDLGAPAGYSSLSLMNMRAPNYGNQAKNYMGDPRALFYQPQPQVPSFGGFGGKSATNPLHDYQAPQNQRPNPFVMQTYPRSPYSQNRYLNTLSRLPRQMTRPRHGGF